MSISLGKQNFLESVISMEIGWKDTSLAPQEVLRAEGHCLSSELLMLDMNLVPCEEFFSTLNYSVENS